MSPRPASEAPGPARPVRRPRSAFVGRRREVESVRALLLAGDRLVTLTGPPGVGKTRMGVEVASGLQRVIPDGIWQIDVGENGADPARDLARALRVRADPDPLEQVVEALAESEALLFIDNCEPVLEAVAIAVSRILDECPHVRVLATSRQALDVEDESVVRVEPLSSEEPGLAGPAARLFLDRARHARPGFEPDEHEASTIRTICELVGGVPLAIELTATQLQYFDLDTIVERLDRQIVFLDGGGGGRERRFTGLRETIDASWTACTTEERQLWAAVSVAAPGWDLATAEAMAAGIGLDARDALGILRGLLARSIVLPMGENAGSRFMLLPALREYGAEHLSDADRMRLELAHVDFVVARMAEVEQGWLSPRQAQLLARLRADLPNTRVALRHCVAMGRSDAALGIATTAWLQNWQVLGSICELESWTTDALALKDAPPALVAVALAVRGVSRGFGRRPGAADDLRAALELAAASGDATALAVAYAGSAEFTGSFKESLDLFERSMDLQGDDAYLYRKLNTPTRYAVALTRAGERERAGEVAARVVEVCSLHGERFEQSQLALQLAAEYLDADDPARAEALAVQSLELKRGLGGHVGVAHAMQVLAGVATAQGRATRAATLLGASTEEWLRDSVIPTTDLRYAPQRQELESTALDRLGQDRYRALVADGRGMRLPTALDFAIDTTADASAVEPAVPASVPGSLTPREADVARLVARGLTNKAIARELFVSIRTVESHVQHALTKLGLNRRTELASWYLAVTDHRP